MKTVVLSSFTSAAQRYVIKDMFDQKVLQLCFSVQMQIRNLVNINLVGGNNR